MEEPLFLTAIAIALFPSALFFALRWIGAPHAALRRPYVHAIAVIVAAALFWHAFRTL